MISAGRTASRGALTDRLRQLLAEAPSSASERELRLAAEIAGRASLPIVLFGAGNLGRRTLELLRDHGQDAVAFVDNDERLWGTFIERVPVLSPSEASSRFAADGLAIVTIWRAEGGHDFSLTRAALQAHGWRWVESFIPLFWGYGADALPYITIDRPSSVLHAQADVLRAANLWSDDRSLREFVGQIEWRLSADFAALSHPEPNQYFADGVVRVGPDEVFVDCGAFTGDTLLDIANRVGSWRTYYAFEPDPASFTALQAAAESLPPELAQRVHLHRAATADRRGTADFTATGLASAKLSTVGQYEVDCVTIDEVTIDAPTLSEDGHRGGRGCRPTGIEACNQRRRAPSRDCGVSQPGGSLGSTPPGARNASRLSTLHPASRRRRL